MRAVKKCKECGIDTHSRVKVCDCGYRFQKDVMYYKKLTDWELRFLHKEVDEIKANYENSKKERLLQGDLSRLLCIRNDPYWRN